MRLPLIDFDSCILPTSESTQSTPKANTKKRLREKMRHRSQVILEFMGSQHMYRLFGRLDSNH